jgi:hypothetical protein
MAIGHWLQWLLLFCSFAISSIVLTLGLSRFHSDAFLAGKGFGAAAAVFLAAIPIYISAKQRDLKPRIGFRVFAVFTCVLLVVYLV